MRLAKAWQRTCRAADLYQKAIETDNATDYVMYKLCNIRLRGGDGVEKIRKRQSTCYTNPDMLGMQAL